VTLFASVRLVRQLNAMINNRAEVGRAATAVVGSDVAHHILDPDGVTELDTARATTLVEALPTVLGREARGWVLAVPLPGRLGLLRGPVELNRAALAAGSAVVGTGGGIALVPVEVGPAVQWRVHRAEPPAPPPTSYEAERALSETVLQAARALARLDVASGPGPDRDPDLGPAPGYPPRQRAAADRAAQLLVAAQTALDHDGASLSSYEAGARRRQLEAVRDAAVEALTAAVSWQPAVAVP
jgi:hypothetical protein